MRPGDLVLIYETAPTMGLTGAAAVAGVGEFSLKALWQEAGQFAAIGKADFDLYFNGAQSGFAISLSSTMRLRSPISRHELVSEFGIWPPQSSRAVDGATAAKLLSHVSLLARHEYSDSGRGQPDDAGELRWAVA